VVLATAGGLAAERRFGTGAQRVSRRSMSLLLYAVMPVVAFFNIARLEITVDVGAGLVLGWLALGGAALIGYGIATRVLRLSRPATGVLVNTAMHGNTAYLGLPLCVALLGAEHLSEAVAYDVLVQLPVFLIGVAGVGATFGTAGGTGGGERLRAFFLRNPPLLGTVAGLLAPAALAPDVLVDATRILVLAMLPIGFFAVGVTMGAESEQGAIPLVPRFGAPEAAAIALRLVVAPLLLLALAAPLIDLPPAYLLQAATPVGISSLVIAHAYALDMGFAAAAIAWTTAVVLVAALAAGLLL
jgi:predicted permease